MEYKEVLSHLAPCGLSCRKCFANEKGEIKSLSAKLQEKLGNFDVYAERFTTLVNPIFQNYPAFKQLLAFFAQGTCRGCREQACGLWPDCGVAKCYRQKGVDFCFQCEEFPCERTHFDPHLHRRWIQMNQRMREIGVETYFEETKDLPRYR